MKIIGIDPGFKGCLVELDTDLHRARCLDMPFRADRIIDYNILKNAFNYSTVNMTFLEKVSGRGGWGANQTFTMGSNYGQILAFLYNKPYTLVVPQKWQQIAHSCTQSEEPKDKSFESFQRLNPKANISRKKDGLIDAFHIARYGLFTYQIEFKDNWEFIIL